MTQCPTPVLLAWETLSPAPGRPRVLERGVVRSPCKRWRCTHCGTGKRAEALKLIRAGAQVGLSTRGGQPLRFVTITYGRDRGRRFDSRADVAASSEDWRRLVQTFRRNGRQMEYVRVLERTRRGRIHIHAITWGDWIPKCTDRGRRARKLPYGRGSGSPCYCTAGRPCIQAMAWAAGFGWVEVRAIKSTTQAAAYVAKYLGKQSAADWPRHARRVAYSRKFAAGLTLGSIHDEWLGEVRARLEALGTLEAVPAGPLTRWECLTHAGQLNGTRAPPRNGAPRDHAGRPFNRYTGELLTH